MLMSTAIQIQFFSTGRLFTNVIKIWLLHYLDIAAKLFKNRTHFNNSRFLINPTQLRCFLNEYQMLMSPATQYNSFQRVHFLWKLSKSFIDQHDWPLCYLRPCSKVFQESNILQQQQIYHQPNTTAMFFKRICYAGITSCPMNLECTPKNFDLSKIWENNLIIGQRSFDISNNINDILLHCYWVYKWKCVMSLETLQCSGT